jgi:hypothetical protein
MSKRRNRHSSQISRASHESRRTVAIEAVLRTHDFVELEPNEPVKLAISQLPGAWYAFRSRRKKSRSSGE